MRPNVKARIWSFIQFIPRKAVFKNVLRWRIKIHVAAVQWVQAQVRKVTFSVIQFSFHDFKKDTFKLENQSFWSREDELRETEV